MSNTCGHPWVGGKFVYCSWVTFTIWSAPMSGKITLKHILFQEIRYILYIESYMRAHVLLNLLNEFGKQILARFVEHCSAFSQRVK